MIMAVDFDEGVPAPPDHGGLVPETIKFFGLETPLRGAARIGGRPYEPRRQQGEMAAGVAKALMEKHNLCVEAPTGVGKSFAYLVPLILFAVRERCPVVVTTGTINLQEQLLEKDIPLLRELMGLEFSAVLAKGRSNYLCRRRLGMAAANQGDNLLPMPAMGADIARLYEWCHTTNGDGSRSTLPFQPFPGTWEFVCCEAGNCLAKKCPNFRRCFYWQARRSWDRAQIIVANHALFFTDMKIKSEPGGDSSLLPPYSAVILDEAHTLEDEAANHLGLRLSDNGLRFMLNRLYDAERARGLLLARRGEAALELRREVAESREACEHFFNLVGQLVQGRQDSVLRLRSPDAAPDLLSGKLSLLGDKLLKFVEDEEDDSFKTEVGARAMECAAYGDGVHDFLNMCLPDSVYWIERGGGGHRPSLTLNAAPLNVDEMLRTLLFQRPLPVVLTSATLTVAGKMDYFNRRVGYCRGGELILDSPFDYQRQVVMHIPESMPPPEADAYTEALHEHIRGYLAHTHGKAFVLFTSYQAMRRCAEELRPFLDGLGIKLLVQGEDKSRGVMLREFRDDINSVIFGTSSFWTGVDVPGESLSSVIITKLPFSVPSHPLIQARCERIRQLGGSPFMDYSLPEAALKLKQGVGRLIRSATDTGIVVILDRRVATQRYGRFFIDSLPKCEVVAKLAQR